MASGVVMAFAGRRLRWASPPIAWTWTAAHGTNGSTSAATHANLRPGYLIVRPLAGSVPAAAANS
jgi:hypothetical protein